MKLAFYKNSKTFFSSLIRLKQRKSGLGGRYWQYSHVELVFSDGVSFSSSETDGGVRFKNIEWKTENWDFIEISISKSKERKIREFCEKESGNKYNMIGIFFAQVCNFNKKGPHTWFCSEIVTYALQKAGLCCTLNSLFTSPGELAYELEGGEYILKDNYEK